MSNTRRIYFSGDTEVFSPYELYRVDSIWLKANGARNWFGCGLVIARPATGPDAWYPVTGYVDYKKYPSLHKCDARCMNAKGHNCECSCGGVNHGKGDL